MAADRRDILIILLNAYLDSLTGTDPDGGMEPLEGVPIAVKRDGNELVIDILLGGEAFELRHPATAAGLADATRAIKDLAHLSAHNVLRLGESLRLDTGRGYFWRDPSGDERRYIDISDDEEGLTHGPH